MPCPPSPCTAGTFPKPGMRSGSLRKRSVGSEQRRGMSLGSKRQGTPLFRSGERVGAADKPSAACPWSPPVPGAPPSSSHSTRPSRPGSCGLGETRGSGGRIPIQMCVLYPPSPRKPVSPSLRAELTQGCSEGAGAFSPKPRGSGRRRASARQRMTFVISRSQERRSFITAAVQGSSGETSILLEKQPFQRALITSIHSGKWSLLSFQIKLLRVKAVLDFTHSNF